jgi:hypothetical protein
VLDVAAATFRTPGVAALLDQAQRWGDGRGWE